MGDNGGQCRKLPYMACDSEMGWFWGWQKESSLSLRSLKPQDTRCFTVTPSVTRFGCRADSHSIPSSRMKSDNTEACHCEINLTTQNDTSIHWSFLGGGTVFFYRLPVFFTGIFAFLLLSEPNDRWFTFVTPIVFRFCFLMNHFD